jgi:hypothetical protein
VIFPRRPPDVICRPGLRSYHLVVAVTDRCGAVLAVIALTVLVTSCAAPHSPAVQHQASLGMHAAAVRYLAIADAGNRRLETDFNRLNGPDRNSLPAAAADLRDVAATERLFDRRLLAIAFPAAAEQTARLLYEVNQSRASLTSAAAGSASLRQLRLFQRRLVAANGPVEEAVRVIRSQLGLPPPETS